MGQGLSSTAEVGGGEDSLWRAKIWMVEDIKCLCPELDLEPLLNVEVLEQREIQVPGQILPNSSLGSRQIA